jgi:UDP-N-acetylglucosamine 2-epimerase (non-hydrolysing)
MKAAPLVEAMKRRRQEFAPLLVHTGQHYDQMMSDVFLRDLELPRPDVSLEVGSDAPAAQTAAVMQKFEPIVANEKPDWVVVVGDVNSTLAGALTAVKMGVKVAHVEAGLRSRDRSMPEEINRLLTDQIADLLLTPSKDANENLRSEGIPDERIVFVGNVMIDSLNKYLEKARASTIRTDLGLGDSQYAVVTLHRPSNVDNHETLAGILEALAKIGNRIPIVFPVHPRTKKTIAELGLMERAEAIPNLRMIEPLGYLDFLALYSNARVVLTDSGGIQEETTVLGIPCLTLRENTERPITVTQGTNVIVGTNPEKIRNAALAVLDDHLEKKRRQIPFWDGHTADRILDSLVAAG